ncbi:MAG: type II toxin-antitoxin system VapC family toxin [Dehalococcoidia bacterium]|nr:type II toxin-antitoxin system VapC family toxin [Dehalococcoidia bacterium]MSQ15995.1 type II toxin-antitoxin system VapC family toxin [Dehalococcoidia bacterium]
MAVYVLDTSAIMCVLYQEEGADRVVEILEASQARPVEDRREVVVPFIALMELEYWLRRRLAPREVDQVLILVENWRVQVVESNPEWRHVAARVKARGSLSLADAWIAALAMLYQGELVHKDPEFDQVAELKSLRLPYKNRL